MELVFLIAMAGIIPLAIVTVYFGARDLLAQKRTEALTQVAGELGMRFSPQGDPALLASLSGLGIFSEGRSRKMTNLMQGVMRGMPVSIFDYKYDTGGYDTDSRTTWRQTMVCFETKTVFPSFSLQPEYLRHKIWSGQDIDFKSQPGFSSHYLLRGNDSAAIRAQFTDRVMTFYDSQHRLGTEASGNRFVFYRQSVLIPPAEIQTFVEQGLQALALFQ